MDQQLEYKSFPTFLRGVEGRVATQVFSVTGVIDMFRDRIKSGAFKKTIKERKDKIRVLWAHQHFDPPIGVLQDIYEIGKDGLPDEVLARYPEATGGLEGKVEYLSSPRGSEVLEGIAKGAIRENSIGFDTMQDKWVEIAVPNSDIKIKIREMIEIRLWDVSPVNWGANPATFNKSAVPFKSTGATRNGPWRVPGLGLFTTNAWETLPEEERRRITHHFAWAEAMPPEAFTGARLPHHSARREGIGPAHFGGITSAMSKLMQATDKTPNLEAVHEHLAKHYVDDFNETPPAFKLIELAVNVREALELGVDLYGYHQALLDLDAALRQAEPQLVGMPVRTHLQSQLLHIQTLRHYVESS